MTTKTASVRLEQELYGRIDSHCVSEECSRNDFIKSAIESKLNKKPIAHARVIEIDGVPVSEIQSPKIVEINDEAKSMTVNFGRVFDENGNHIGNIKGFNHKPES